MHLRACVSQDASDGSGSDDLQTLLIHAMRHEVRSHQTNIRMMQYVLSEQTPGSPEFNQTLAGLHNAIRQMDETIAFFLDMLEVQSRPPQVRPTSLLEVVPTTVDEFRLRAMHKRVTLTIRERAVSPVVLADGRMLGRALANVIGNAVKFSPPGGTVTIDGSPTWGGYWGLHVMDEGVGVRADEEEAIFRPFVQASAQPTGGEGGSGLGLWIARHLLTTMHGAIGVSRATAGGGACFSLILPLSRFDETTTGEMS